MCGIAGIISLKGGPLTIEDRTSLARMSETMHHRGPDDDGIVITLSQTAEFAHRRLSIIDPTPEGHQPMVSESGNILVFNGEIYNYLELRSRYKLNVPPSDTAVLLALLEQKGISVLAEFRGFFSFGFWNEREQELILARDAFGKKPLYYGIVNDRFLFASELRAILASGIIPLHLSREAVAQYLRFYSVPHPYSMVEGISMLPQGTILTLSANGSYATKRWYRLPTSHSQMIDYEDAQRETRRILERSVRDRLVSDVPVGAFLSGGLDSNAIVGLAALNGEIETYTLGFNSSSLDERRWAQIGASHFGTKHTECTISDQEIPELLPVFFQAMDSPTGDGLNSFLISRAVRKVNPSLKVVLSGVGGDEAFLGYAKYRWLAKQASMFRAIWSLPRSMRASISERIMQLDHSRARSGFRSAVFPEGSRFLFSENEIARLIGTNSTSPSDTTLEKDPLLALLRSDIEHYLPDMLLHDLDAMTMYFGLEGRAPLLDRELLEFTWQLPLSIKTRGSSKQLLADAVSDTLPEELKQKPKTGFELPMNMWLKTSLRTYLDLLLSSDLEIFENGLIQKDAVRKVHADFLRGASHYLKPWSIIVLEHWLREMKSFLSTHSKSAVAAL